MDRADLTELEALHRAATPGSWFSSEEDCGRDDEGAPLTAHYVTRVPNGAPDDGGDIVCGMNVAMFEKDARFIAAARNALPALLARLRALEEVARANAVRDRALLYAGRYHLAWDAQKAARVEAPDDFEAEVIAGVDAALAAAKEGV